MAWSQGKLLVKALGQAEKVAELREKLARGWSVRWHDKDRTIRIGTSADCEKEVERRREWVNAKNLEEDAENRDRKLIILGLKAEVATDSELQQRLEDLCKAPCGGTDTIQDFGVRADSAGRAFCWVKFPMEEDSLKARSMTGLGLRILKQGLSLTIPTINVKESGY